MEKIKNIEYSKFGTEIQEMAALDQEMRNKVFKNEGTEWDFEIDKRNTERMKEIVSEIGWPTISKVGKENSYKSWLLVQHADHDIVFQKHCLSLMKEVQDDIEKKNIAYLEDRVLSAEEGYQWYGTQFIQQEGKYIPKTIKDLQNVDTRRKEMELETLEEGIKNMNARYLK